MKIKIGDRITFRRADGAVVEDIVRDKFTYFETLEPYARNRSFPALVLTNHSWCAESDVIEAAMEEK